MSSGETSILCLFFLLRAQTASLPRTYFKFTELGLPWCNAKTKACQEKEDLVLHKFAFLLFPRCVKY